MRPLIFLLLLLASLPASAASLPEVKEVVACTDDAPAPPDFTRSTCRRMMLRDVDPQARQVWIRAVLAIPGDLRVPVGVRFSTMASSELWWNDVRIGRNGTPGATAPAEAPGRMDAMIPLPDALLHPGENVLIARLSAWHQPWRAARPIQQIVVEPYADPTLRTLRQYLITLLTFGVFAIAAVYFAVAWITDRRDGGSLALMLLSVATSLQLGFEVSRGVVAYAYPWQGPRLAAILACAACVGLSMIAYAVWRYRRRQARWWIAGGAIPIAVACELPIGFDARSMLVIALGAAIAGAATIGAAWRTRNRGAQVMLCALLGFALLIAVRPDFLDTSLYLALALLAAVLFGDQIFTLRRTERARVQAITRTAQLELALLRQAIAPHFLLNTLNSLIDWVETDPAQGVAMIEILGDEFRTLSRIAGMAAIPLSEEIALCRGHLTLMAFRTDAQLDFVVEGDETGLETPPGVLLTLVENAFVHGRYAEETAFVLKIERNGDVLRSLELTTPPSLTGVVGGGTGTGLAYVRARIVEAFGAGAGFEAGLEGSAWRSRIVMGGKR